MKYIILLAALFVSAQATAQEVSRETASAQHIERVRDGKVETYDGDEWMIIKKGPKKPKPKAVVVAPVAPKVIEKEVIRTVEKTVTVTKIQKNRVSLVGGVGATGKVDYSFDSSAGTFKAKSDVGGVAGLMYQRKFTDKMSVGVEGLSSKTGLLMIGLDF